MGIAAALVFAVPAAAVAQAADPAAATVDSLNDGLLGIMKTSGGVDARFRKAEPVVARAFDVAAMTRTSIGPAWTGLSAADQAALTKAFGRFTAATYAKNFDAFSGERFTVDPKVETRGPDKLVKSQLVPKSGAPTHFIYRLRQSGGSWKIIDVFYNGAISQLAAQRSQFSANLAQGGAPALLKVLNDKTDALLK
jgi:phospholipid transport system substrate-binding protein